LVTKEVEQVLYQSLCKIKGYENVLRTFNLLQLAETIANIAVWILRRNLKNVDVSIVGYKEEPGAAVGNGSGIK
jgi:hypothetical protein